MKYQSWRNKRGGGRVLQFLVEEIKNTKDEADAYTRLRELAQEDARIASWLTPRRAKLVLRLAGKTEARVRGRLKLK